LTDRGAAALAEFLCEAAVGHYRGWGLAEMGEAAHMGMGPDDHLEDARAILGEHGVFLPDGREVERLLTEWAERFLGGLSFNEPSLQRRGWAKERAPDIATSIRAALEGGSK
jgi:hypothetical protein